MRPTHIWMGYNLCWENSFWSKNYLFVSSRRTLLGWVSTHWWIWLRENKNLLVTYLTVWSFQLALKQRSVQPKSETKRKELQHFIDRSRRTWPNQSRRPHGEVSKNWTSWDWSLRCERYPGIVFKPEREAGDQIFMTEKSGIKAMCLPTFRCQSNGGQATIKSLHLQDQAGGKISNFLRQSWKEIPVTKRLAWKGVTINRLKLTT